MTDTGPSSTGDPDFDTLTESEVPRDLTRTVVRGASLAGAGYLLAQVLNLGFYLALARLASPADFGEFAAGSILVGVGLLITESGMLSAVVQRRDRVEEAANTAVLSTAAAGVGFSLFALAVSPLIGLFFDSSTIGAVAAVMSGTILLRSVTAAPDALLQRRFSFLRRVVVEPATVVAFGVAAVIATSKGMGVWGLVIGQYAAGVTDVVLSWALARWRPRPWMATWRMWRELVAYGRHIVAATIVLRVGEQADTIWLGRFLGAAPLGQYRYAFRLASTPYWAILAAASYVLFPAFARIATDRQRFQDAFLRSLRWMCVASFPAGMILLPLGEPLAVLLFGEVWREAGQAAAAMCVYTAASSLSSIASEALKAHGRPDLLTRMHTLTTVATAGLMGALLPLGLEGVAAGLSIGALAGGIYAIWVVGRTIEFPAASMWREIWPPAVSAIAMAGFVLALELFIVDAERHGTLPGAGLLVAEGIAGAAFFIVALWLVGPETVRELLRAARGLGARVLPALRRAQGSNSSGSDS